MGDTYTNVSERTQTATEVSNHISPTNTESAISVDNPGFRYGNMMASSGDNSIQLTQNNNSNLCPASAASVSDMSTQEYLRRAAIENGQQNLSFEETSPDPLVGFAKSNLITENETVRSSPIIGAHGKMMVQNRRQALPITNHTLDSQRQSKIVIIKPTAPNAKELISDPVEIINCIQNSPFNNTDKIADIRVNKRRNIIVAELKKGDQVLINQLLEVTNLGSWSVECSQPNTDTVHYGVISPIGLNTKLQGITALIDTHSENCTVTDAIRLKKRTGGVWTDSTSLKLAFKGDHKVDHITIGMSYYKVRPFIPEPLQCFNCQRLGHGSSGCPNKIRCLLCGAEHDKKNCTVPQDHQRCANCRGNHRANSKECWYIRQACEIERIKIVSNKTHNEARSEFVSNRAGNLDTQGSSLRSENFPRLPSAPAPASYSRSVDSPQVTSYSNAVMRNRIVYEQKETKTVSTQTVYSNNLEMSPQFIEKISRSFIDILRIFGVGDNSEHQKEVVKDTLMMHLGAKSVPTTADNKKRPAETDTTEDESTDETDVLSDSCTINSGEFITVEKRQMRTRSNGAKAKEQQEVKKKKQEEKKRQKKQKKEEKKQQGNVKKKKDA